VALIGLLPTLALCVGVACGLGMPWSARAAMAAAVAWTLLAAVAWRRQWPWVTTAALVGGFAACGAASAAQARDAAVRTTLRALLDATYGGFALESLGPPGRHDPVRTRAVILEDASARDGFVAVRAAVRQIAVGGRWHDVSGNVAITVSGTASRPRMTAWTEGRTIEAPVTFRRPARYLDEGVADFERDAALDGTTLLGSVKSGFLVDVQRRAGPFAEAAARSRAAVRRAVDRWVGSRNPTAGAITTAVLIGDRAAIPRETREQLQAAGTYHVITISGGNIGIFVALVFGLCAAAGLPPRASAVLTTGVLALYAVTVVSGASVRRAVLVAGVSIVSRAFDHRTRAWQAAAVAAGLMLAAWQLDLRDVGFQLTFGAAGALLLLAGRLEPRPSWPRAVRWTAAAVLASLAVEAALLPLQASVFSRVTLAGVALNLGAVPAMAVVQIAGMAVVALDVLHLPASAFGAAADWASRVILSSAAWVDGVPALAPRVPPPALAIVLGYYGALLLALFGPRRTRAPFGAATVVAAVVIATGARWPSAPGRQADTPQLRLTMLDAGQAEAMLLQPPAGPPLLVDTGGSPFGSALDIGARVVVPALWARGVTALGAMVITHGDPDHIGGAPGVLASLPVQEAWFGVRVPRHGPENELLANLAVRRVGVRYLRAGTTIERGGVRIRVLHPPEPDWERPVVRNDDSVVLEVRYGEVALLLAGDISADVERSLLPQLSPARIRVLKVAHHGSRTSTNDALIEAWRPQYALISAGRGNSFGHPARDVIERLERAGARILRTDRDGEITISTDGRTLRWKTFVPAKGRS
jgi:competence protein ComEC